MREPKRGQQEDLSDQAESKLKTKSDAMPVVKAYKTLFGNGGFMFAVLGYAAYTFVVGGLSFWMPTYIVRYFDGVTAERGNIVFGAVTVVGGFIGTVVGGFLADKIEKRSGNGYLKVAVLSMVLSVPVFWILLSIRDFNHFAMLLFVLDIFLFMCMSPLDAAVIGSVRPALRSTAMALNIFLIHALGDGISRVLMGLISDSSGLQSAVALLPWVLALAGVLWAMGIVGYWQPMLWPKGALSIPKYQAHRGFRPTADVQENTLNAFRRAKASGAEMVECDVQLSRDGHAVIFHDADLVRIGNSKEKFGEL
ncbi:MAG: MFS transporter, partial [Proteobacteria bacterium]